MAIQPLLRLDVGLDRDVFGWVTYPSDFVSWDLRGYFSAQSSAFTGLEIDPTGQYVMQSQVPVWMDADETQWTSTSGTYTHGTGAQDLGGKKFLRSTGTGAFSTTHNYARGADEGLSPSFFIGAGTASDPTFYVAFNSTLRLAFEAGQTIRLQTFAGGQWSDCGVSASGLGECEQYLSSVNRRVSVDVLPMTDASWEAAYPNSLAVSGPPPNLIAVTLNGGDAVLQLPATSLPAGSLKVSGSNRLWSCAYAAKRFGVTAQALLPAQARPRVFATTPDGRLGGYAPPDGTGLPIASVSVTAVAANQASATVTVDASGLVDTTGYSVRSCFLLTAEADFPSLQVPPNPSPPFTSYYPMRAEWEYEYDPLTSTVRGSARVHFSNADLSLTPDKMHMATRAARLWVSLDFGDTWTPVITGWTSLAPGEGASWSWEAKQPYFTVTISDRLCKGDNTVVGYLPPFDRQCHFYAQRTLLRREGMTDDWMQFPYVQRNDVVPFYYLPGGTSADPAMQFSPSTLGGEAREQVRAKSAELDPISGTPCPMAFSLDALGNVYYFPLPVGVVNMWLLGNQSLSMQGLTPAITYSAVPAFSGGEPLLNEILNSGLRSWMSLANVRTPVVYEGIDPASGNAVLGWAYNEALGGGQYSDPYSAGYVGTDTPFYEISKLVSTEAYAELLAVIAYTQLGFPSIGCDLRLHCQPWLMPLTIIAVKDYATQGSADPVAYYVTAVSSVVEATRATDGEAFPGFEETRVSARLLGEAA